MTHCIFLLFVSWHLLLTVRAEQLDVDVKWILQKITQLEQENAALKEKVEKQIASTWKSRYYYTFFQKKQIELIYFSWGPGSRSCDSES